MGLKQNNGESDDDEDDQLTLVERKYLGIK
jgi:hypothetical protein